MTRVNLMSIINIVVIIEFMIVKINTQKQC